MNKKDDLIKHPNGDIYRGYGHLGGNEKVGYKYMPKEQTPLKKTKKRVKKGK